MQNKYLIIGNKGQLGSEFERQLLSAGNNVTAVDADELDISDEPAIIEAFDSIQPDIVINCAAYNLVDKAETEVSYSFLVNALGPELLARQCEKHASKIVHFSSDYIFNGKKGTPYLENDNPDPLNVYGMSKLDGEKRISETTDNHLIFRVSWLYGNGNQNFIHKLIQWSAERDQLQIAFDEISVPTYTGMIVWLTLRALSEGICGLYHCVPMGSASRFDWAKAIANEIGLQNELIPVSKEIFNLPAKRPTYSVLDNSKIASELGISLPSWEMELKYFLFALKSSR